MKKKEEKKKKKTGNMKYSPNYFLLYESQEEKPEKFVS